MLGLPERLSSTAHRCVCGRSLSRLGPRPATTLLSPDRVCTSVCFGGLWLPEAKGQRYLA